MGQAKQRGTFEQRRQAALERNAIIEASLPKMGKRAEAYANHYGIQKLANRLAAVGALPTISLDQPTKNQ